MFSPGVPLLAAKKIARFDKTCGCAAVSVCVLEARCNDRESFVHRHFRRLRFDLSAQCSVLGAIE